MISAKGCAIILSKPMLLTIIDNIIISGLLMGGIYALIAAGLSLQYGVARVFNVAHGEFIMIAAFITFFLKSFLNINPNGRRHYPGDAYPANILVFQQILGNFYQVDMVHRLIGIDLGRGANFLCVNI